MPMLNYIYKILHQVVNQPAEYKIVAEIKNSINTIKTITSDVVIKAEDILFNYYDASGFYVNNSTRYLQSFNYGTKY